MEECRLYPLVSLDAVSWCSHGASRNQPGYTAAARDVLLCKGKKEKGRKEEGCGTDWIQYGVVAMSKPRQRHVNPDFTRPVVIGGLFLLAAVIAHGIFMLANTKLYLSPSIKTEDEEPLSVTADMLDLKAVLMVDAREGWQGTNLFVEKGSRIRIKVLDGKWTEWSGVRDPGVGDGSEYICGEVMNPDDCVEPVPDFPSGALIGRIDKQVLKIGSSGKFTTEESGMLKLRINDADSGLYDNSGVLKVEIVVSVR